MFGQILKNLRVSDGIPQTRFAKEIGFSQASVAAWENNTREPGIETLVLIAQYFNVTVDYLVTGKGTFSPSNTNAAQSALSKDEQKLIDTYRALNEKNKLHVSVYASIRLEEQDGATSTRRG